MGFVWCSISGKLYGKHAPPELNTPHTITQDSELLDVLKKGEGEQHQQAVDFLTHLAVCNTVVPATTAAGQLIYQVSYCLHALWSALLKYASQLSCVRACISMSLQTQPLPC